LPIRAHAEAEVRFRSGHLCRSRTREDDESEKDGDKTARAMHRAAIIPALFEPLAGDQIVAV
jgi:hypothetical protein